MKAAIFPDVTTSRCIGKASSIEVIGLSNDIFLVTWCVRRSHHLIGKFRLSAAKRNLSGKQHPLDKPIIAPTHSAILVKPYNALDRAIMRLCIALG
jgi:hypothetical protein